MSVKSMAGFKDNLRIQTKLTGSTIFDCDK